MQTNFDQSRDRLDHLLRRVTESNPFYRAKFASYSLADFQSLPFTTKAELVANQAMNPPYGTNHTVSLERFTRIHQSSGTTTGHPMRWLDTTDGWNWVVSLWQSTFADMGLSAADRCFFPFSFGPFLGFWSAFEASVRSGCFTMSGGGMTSIARLRNILDHGITAVFCTPTYALHLAELAHQEKIDLVNSNVRTIVVAGEPGGNIPATKQRIEQLWSARVLDHYGMTEVGPVAFELRNDPGSLTVLDREMIVELIEPQGTIPVECGEVGELVVTNLGRIDSPLIRYRTGDLFRYQKENQDKSRLRLRGGCLGRADDMLHVRGNNLYPAALEAVVRRFPAVAEFRIVVMKVASLADLTVEIEPIPDCDAAGLTVEVAQALRNELHFRIEVAAVPPGSLPRFELKAKRVVVK